MSKCAADICVPFHTHTCCGGGFSRHEQVDKQINARSLSVPKSACHKEAQQQGTTKRRGTQDCKRTAGACALRQQTHLLHDLSDMGRKQ